jgi:hypothetical protein
MAAQASSLEITVGRALPLDGCNLIFASTDSQGTPGALNRWVLSQLGLATTALSDAAKSLDRGYAIVRPNTSQTLVLVVTVGSQDSKQLLKLNLSAVLSASTDLADVGQASLVWLPLMGTGAGGLGLVDSLETTLGAIAEGYASGNLMWRSLRISLAKETNQQVADRLVAHIKEFFAKGPVAVTVTALPATSDTSGNVDAKSSSTTATPDTIERGYRDNLQTQIDAPPAEPLLRFPEIAAKIVDVVEETVHSDDASRARRSSELDTRHREWLSAADARLTIGIFAPWGAGKSTLINALRSVFMVRDYPVFAVNPWKWDGRGDLHDHVRATVIEQARRQGKVPMLVAWLKLRTLWRNYRTHLWLGALAVALIAVFYRPLMALLSLPAANQSVGDEFGQAVMRTAGPGWLIPAVVVVLPVITKFLGGWITRQIESKWFQAVPDKLGADGLSLVYRDIATLIYRNAHPPRPFVFFFDDLDRCSPERVAAVLESVHSLTAAGCIVFLACDDEYVTAALNAHYDKVAKVYRDGKVFGRSYLEKIVQIQFRLPLLKNADIFELGLAETPEAQRAGAPAGQQQPVLVASGGGLAGTPEQGVPQETAAATQAERKAELDARLQEIIGDLLGEAVEPLGLNIRQAKAISNTLKLYLRISDCQTEREARRLAAFVFAERFDPGWLDGLYHGVAVSDSPIGAIPNLASRLSTMIGTDQAPMLQMYRLLGRRPGRQPAPPEAASPVRSAALAAQ